MHKIEVETGFDPGFINNGGIFIAHDEVSFVDGTMSCSIY